MLHFSLVGASTLKNYYENLKIYPSRRAAFRAAKRDARMPVSQSPTEVIRPNSDKGKEYHLDNRNVRLYIFHFLIGAIVVEYHIREDDEAKYDETSEIGDQPPHFNSGEPPQKLKKHHYFWKKNERNRKK